MTRAHPQADPPSRAPLAVGLVGAGVMGHIHARAWTARLPGVLQAMYTPNARARTLALEYGLQPFDSLQDLCARVDVLDLCTPTPTHLTLTRMAARAGCHVVCEKPAALTPQDALEMGRECERAGVRLFIAHVVRFFPQYREVARRVLGGEIGPARVIRLSRIGSPPPKGSWLLDEAQSGGVPLDLMLHDLDYARWLAGEVERVYAVQTRQGERVMVQATLEHASGAISSIEGGWAAPAGVFRTALDVAGTAGVLEWSSDAAPSLCWHGASEPLPPQGGAALPALEGDPYADELEHAYHAIFRGTPFSVTLEDAARAIALSLAVRNSIESGQAVTPEALP